MYAKLIFSFRYLIILAFFSVSSYAAYAKDISNEQRNAYKARQAYNQNKSDYESLLTQIEQQERYLAQQQQKLDQLLADKMQAKAKLDESKKHLDAEVKTLNQVWELRDK